MTTYPNREDTIEKPSLFMAVTPVILTLIILMVQVFVYDGAPHIPLFLGIVITALFAMKRGYSWEYMQAAMTEVVGSVIPVFGIFLTVGMVIGVWILSGTVPLLIDYGLAALSPAVFLAVGCIVCSIVSVATGTSWGTTGTIGLALIGIGEGLGIPIYLTAGAIVSGAFFGDKLSPLSDTTNFSAALCDVPLYTHIRNMLPSTIPSMGLAIIIYAIIGMQYADNELNTESLVLIDSTISANFNLNVLLLIPPIVVIVAALKGVSPLPGMFFGVFAGGVIAVLVQGASIGDVMSVMMNGYKSDTGVEYIDNLLSKGGMMSMTWVMALLLFALSYGSLLEKTRCLETILDAIFSRVKGRAGMVTATVFSALGLNVSSDLYVAMTLTGRMYTPGYRKMGYSSANVSRIIEDGITLSSPLIPWNAGGVFVTGALGVPALVYAPFAFANWLAPLFDLLWGWTGYFVPKMSDSEKERYLASLDEMPSDEAPEVQSTQKQ